MVKLLHPSVKTVGIDNNGKLVVPAAGLINSDGTAFSAGGGGGGGSGSTFIAHETNISISATIPTNPDVFLFGTIATITEAEVQSHTGAWRFKAFFGIVKAAAVDDFTTFLVINSITGTSFGAASLSPNEAFNGYLQVETEFMFLSDGPESPDSVVIDTTRSVYGPIGSVHSDPTAAGSMTGAMTRTNGAPVPAGDLTIIAGVYATGASDACQLLDYSLEKITGP